MDIIKRLKENGIQFEKGLSLDELNKIEKIYDIHFPKELENLYITCLPVSNGFYKWRDFGEQNIAHIKELILMPYNNIAQDIEDIEWSDTWGNEPNSFTEREKIIKYKMNVAPKLIPLYSHRYIVSTEKGQAPIFSLHGTDIICYGENIQKYFEIEFMGKPYSEIEFDKVLDIPFWGEII